MQTTPPDGGLEVNDGLTAAVSASPLSDAPWPLVAAASEIFDQTAVTAALDVAASSDGDVAAKRQMAVAALSEALRRGRARIRAAFDEGAAGGLATAHSLAWLMDRVVASGFAFVAERLFNRGSRTTGERVAVAAVGGYGRGELAPFSDVDLLFVTPYKQTGWGEDVIETTLYLLWDLKLKVGHATRSVDECLRRAQHDVVIRTTVLEKRWICGDRALFNTLDRRLWDELFDKTGPDFIEAKLAEREERHQKTGGSRYLLEPNVKESKGGLRDVQTLFWIAKYLYRADTPDELVAKGVFSRDEAMRCRRAAGHLWTVRCALHYAAGRAQEKLTFDMQIELAERFGYRRAEGQMPVERFMKRYFLAAKAVGDLTGIFCAALEAQHKKAPPLLGGILRFFSGGEPTLGEAWMCVKDGRLALAENDAFHATPGRIFEFIETALRQGLAPHPAALRQINRARRRVDDAVRADPETQARVMALMTTSRDPVRALRILALTGVLGRFIPDFGRIVGQMQFNMYHHYTVDEHSLLAVETLHRLCDGQLADEEPFAAGLAAALPDRRVMAVALLLHDAGKGLGEDHSIVGARIARRVGPGLGLSQAETEQVAWLIENHLAMSDTAQKRDLAEPATVRAFAELVRSPARLKMLYLLTICDIKAVGPGVLNGWKRQLLRQLYHECRAILAGEAAGVSRDDRIAAAQAALRLAIPQWPDARWQAHLARFAPPYWTALAPPSHRLQAELISQAEESGAADPSIVHMAVESSQTRSATEAAFYTADHPGLFARMAGAFALVGASVVDARAFTTHDGMAINTFWAQDSDGQPFSDPARLKVSVERVLRGEVVARDALRQRRKLRPREKPFHVAPSIVFDNDAADQLTLIEVNARDRVGLLHDLAKALAAANVNIVSAIIATYGEHAVDVFYVKDVFGLKVTGRSKQAQIEKALLAAIDRADGRP